MAAGGELLFVAEGPLPLSGGGDAAVFQALHSRLVAPTPETAAGGPPAASGERGPPAGAPPPTSGEGAPRLSLLDSYGDTLVLASSKAVRVLLPKEGGPPCNHRGPPSRKHWGPPSCFLPPRAAYVFRPRTVVRSVACGAHHVLLGAAGGLAFSLGLNSEGQLGDGSFEDKTEWVGVGLLRALQVVSVHAGPDFSFAVCRSSQFTRGVHTPQTGGDVVCAWGSNSYGQLGQGPSFEGPCSPLPLQVPSLIPHAVYTAVACAWGYALLLTSEGRALGFGLNLHGQLGSGSLGPQGAPQLVALEEPLASLSCSDYRVLAIARRSCAVFSWGAEPSYTAPPKLRLPVAWPQRDPLPGPPGAPLSGPPEARAVLLPRGGAEEVNEALGGPEEGGERLPQEGDRDCCPFSKAPAVRRERGLPKGLSSVSAGFGLNCAICRGPPGAPNCGAQTLCTWPSGGPSGGPPEGHAAAACRVAAELPSWGWLHAEGRHTENAKLKWGCACSHTGALLLWAEAEAPTDPLKPKLSKPE